MTPFMEKIMKKTERINDMLIFLNNKKSFNLSDLMERYSISKSTALRDVQSLEQIGMPIYSELGRNGKYEILDSSILSPIFFTVDEMYALYFCLLTLNGYKTKPFEIENIVLENKFSNILPENVRNNILIMNQVLSLEVTNHSNFSPYLKEILQGIFTEKVYRLTYLKKEKNKQIIAQFIRIQSKFGQWYAKIFNFTTEKIQILRCDKILSVIEINDFKSKKLEELLNYIGDFHKEHDAINFTIIVNKEGKDFFTKENYPSMKIHNDNENFLITGYFNKGEEDFIADYFLKFGQSIISISPVMLKKLIYDKAKFIEEHLNSL